MLRMRNRTTLPVAIFATLGVALSSTATGSSSEIQPVRGAIAFTAPDSGRPAVSDEDNSDLVISQLANYWNVSAVEAARMLSEQHEFGDLTAVLRQEFPDRLAAAWVERVPTSMFSISFVGEVPPEAKQHVDEAGLNVDLVGDAPMSELDLENLQADVDAELYESVGPNFTTGTDARKGVVSVTLPDHLEGDSQALPTSIERSDVQIRYDKGPYYLPQADVYGGALVHEDDYSDLCTSGFSVENHDGVGGLVTAGHCGNEEEERDGILDVYRNPENGNPTTLNHRDRGSPNFGDAEWYSTPAAEDNKIYIRDTRLWAITDVVQIDTFFNGRTFCFYGRGTDEWDCSDVNDASRTCGPYGHFVEMRHGRQRKGDSGGPWFDEHKAAGVHAGLCGPEGDRKSVFTKAGRLNIMLGVHVRVQPH